MANEFVARNGIIAQNDSTITGKLTVTNGITGSVTTASYVALAQTASYITNAVSASYAATASFLVGTISSASFATNAINANTASYAQFASQSLSSSFSTTAVTANTASYVLNTVSASYATTAVTASYATNFTVSGTLTAQTIVAQIVTSSVEFASGSNIIGNNLTNTQQITGSVTITGSLAVNGSPVILSSQTASISVATASYVLNAISASYSTLANTASYVILAQTASYVANAGTSSYFNGNTLILSQSLFSNQSVGPQLIGAQTILTNATSSYNSAFYNYSIVSASNLRVGQFMAGWSGSNIQFTDMSTNDIGSTSGVNFTASLNGANILLTTIFPSAGWVVRTVVTFL